jgi:hypothetical protein
MNSKQAEAIAAFLAARGLERLPDSAYGEHVRYLMVRVPGRKTAVRVLAKIPAPSA